LANFDGHTTCWLQITAEMKYREDSTV